MTAGVLELTVLLGASVLFVMIFRRLGLGAVLGYLIAGAVVGPFGLGLVGGGEEKMRVAEIGIAMLLFLVGLELNPTRLLRLKREIFGLGLAQLMVTAAALAVGLWLVTGFTTSAIVALALALALSSTAQVLPGLRESGRINTPDGERAFSILLMQDLSLIPMIAIIGAMTRDPGVGPGTPMWQQLALTVAAVMGLVLAGRFLLNPLLRIVGRIGERELFVLVGLATVLAASALMHALHLSTALGAFIAGVMLADSPYRHELEADVEPFRSLLLGLFFLAVGMVLDLDVVAARPFEVIGLAIGLVAIKTLALWVVARAFGMRPYAALGMALLLSQGGEFAFVLFAQAGDALLLAPEAVSLFSAVVTLSMATTPFLMILGRRLEARVVRSGADLPGPQNAAPSEVILVGYGRFGQIVAQVLHAADLALTLIDSKAEQIELSQRFDTKVYYGDGLRLDVLRHAGADSAAAIILCIRNPDIGPEQLLAIRRAFPQARLFMRMNDRRQQLALAEVDLAGRVRDTFESAITLGRKALATLDFNDDEVDDIEAAVRQLDKARFEEQARSGDLAAASHLRFTEERRGRPQEVLDKLLGRRGREGAVEERS